MSVDNQFQVESTANLANAAVFSGTAHEFANPSPYREFVAAFSSSHAGAANGAKIQASVNGSNWYDVAVASLAAGVPQVLTAPVCAKYMRAQLTNGATLTTSLFIATQFRANGG